MKQYLRFSSIIAMAAIAAAPLASTAQEHKAANASRFTGNSLSASGTDNAGGQGYRYQSVQAYESQDVKGKRESVSVQVSEYFSAGTSWGYRAIGCSLPDPVLETSKNGARLSVVVDSANAQCQTYYGVRHDSASGDQPWVFSSETVTASVADPRYTSDGNSRYTYRDNVTGTTQKSNCKDDFGYGATGSIRIGASAPMTLGTGTGWGYFEERKCNYLSR